MLLSRFWYVFLALLALAAVGAAVFAKSVVDLQWVEATEDELRRDRFEIEALLKLDARARLDALTRFAFDEQLRAQLRQASEHRPGHPVAGEVRTALTRRIGSLNRQLEDMAGDLVFAVNQRGYIVAQIAPGRRAGGGLGGFPLVQRALAGFVRDDVWVLNGVVYRMAARPVIEGGRFVGALVHGKRVDDRFAELLSSRLGEATVAFFRGETAFASYMPAGVRGAPQREQVQAALPAAVGDASFGQDGRTANPLRLESGGMATFSLVTGAARQAGVGYAVARPVPQLSGPLALFDQAGNETWTGALSSGFALGAMVVLLLMVGLAMASVWAEHDRPLAKLLRATAGLGQDQAGHFGRLAVTDFGGRHRKLAEAINQVLDRAAGSRALGQPKAANLDEILAPGEEAAPGNAFFGFGQEPSAVGAAPGGFAPPPAAPSPAVPPPAAPSPAAPLPGEPPPASPSSPGHLAAGLPAPALGFDTGIESSAEALSSLPAPPPDPEDPDEALGGGAPHDDSSGSFEGRLDQRGPAHHAAPAFPAAPAPPAPPLPPAPPKVPRPAAASFDDLDDDDDEKTTMMVEPHTGAAFLSPSPADYAAAAPEEEEDDGATMVAQVPEELLAQASASMQHGPDDDEQHFQDVYEQFVATKRQCRESIAGLTFEKFRQTLERNQNQIVKKHGAKKVRFTVYVKAGKAALKATPIRE